MENLELFSFLFSNTFEFLFFYSICQSMIGEKLVFFSAPPQKASTKIPLIVWALIYGISIGLVYTVVPGLILQIFSSVLIFFIIKCLAERSLIDTFIIYCTTFMLILVTQGLILLSIINWLSLSETAIRFTAQILTLTILLLVLHLRDFTKVLNRLRKNKLERSILFGIVILLQALLIVSHVL
ncbi:MAG: hypothetical protein FWE07_02650 [Turicibacter sp.]|nr:hypothetical protein [Turicibacter sp.]